MSIPLTWLPAPSQAHDFVPPRSLQAHGIFLGHPTTQGPQQDPGLVVPVWLLVVMRMRRVSSVVISPWMMLKDLSITAGWNGERFCDGISSNHLVLQAWWPCPSGEDHAW